MTWLSKCFIGFLATASAHIIPRADPSASPFSLSELSLTSGRWLENQERTLNYLKWVDLDRILYVFRENHGLSTEGANANGGWDAPDFPFRSHFQGHVLTAWAHCYATLKDEECLDRAKLFVAELAKCQENNEEAGFNEGYLSGFPESEIDKVEDRSLSNGNVPYYAIHKTMAGLLDVWQLTDNDQALSVLESLASWVDYRTGKLSYDQMQAMMQTEFGGMNEVLADMARRTGEKKWIAVAQRFDHALIFDPLAAKQDKLSGLHANTQIPKWIGAVLEYHGTGEQEYLDIAKNAWDLTVSAHTYAIGANSVAEHFRDPNQIAEYLNVDTAEACNSYNMLKLTRELWTLSPQDAQYFDFYETTLINHLIGQQNPESDHGHVTYFTSLNPGGHRGVGPAWGGGTWSTDDDSFWCCQGTALETNTKLMDSIYFQGEDSLYVNLFAPSKLNWSKKEVVVTQKTEYPKEDTTTLEFSGKDAELTVYIRIPAWTSDAKIKVNGEDVDVDAKAGSYAAIKRAWKDGDKVEVQLPMKLRVVRANDDDSVGAISYGPVVLSANYGSSELESLPTIDLGSVKATDEALEFEATADDKTVTLGAFYDAHGYNYNVYWKLDGELSN